MRFAIISADLAHAVSVKINPEEGDATSFLNWLDVLSGVHLSFKVLKESGYEYLRHFDIVMMSGHPSHIVDIINIAKYLKDKDTVTMFYPEGSTQLYDNSIRGFHREYYDAWRACDILSIAEEDKAAYYSRFVGRDTLVRFVHVPLRKEMEAGEFLVARKEKANTALVYGDNNPNHPMIAMACAARVGLGVVGIDTGGRENADQFASMFKGTKFSYGPKQSLYSFLRHLGRSLVHFYPTEWIGTARQQIACAVVGTPCIGNKDSHTQRRLFPNLGCYIYDVDAMEDLAEMLINDEKFYERVCDHAFKEVSFYGMEATKARFMEAYDQARRVKAERLVAA